METYVMKSEAGERQTPAVVLVNHVWDVVEVFIFSCVCS